MLFYRLCLIALVVGMINGEDSGGEDEDEDEDEESDAEQNFSIPNEDLDGVHRGPQSWCWWCLNAGQIQISQTNLGPGQE